MRGGGGIFRSLTLADDPVEYSLADQIRLFLTACGTSGHIQPYLDDIGSSSPVGLDHSAEHRLRDRRLAQHDIGRFARFARSQVLPLHQAGGLHAFDIDMGRDSLDESEVQRVRAATSCRRNCCGGRVG